MEHDDFLGHCSEKFLGSKEYRKGSPVFPDRTFQTEIRVPFLQKWAYLWYQFFVFAAVFRSMELICTNGKRDSGTEFTSP